MDSQQPPGQEPHHRHRPRTWLARIGGLLLWPLVAVHAVLTGILWPAFRPLIARFSRLTAFEKLGAWLRTLPPYPALLTFAVPFAILEPLKGLAVWHSASGHPVSGMSALLALHGVSLLTTERLFVVLKPTLLGIAWFALIWGRVELVRDRLSDWIRATEAWTVLATMGNAIRRRAGEIWTQMLAVFRRFRERR